MMIHDMYWYYAVSFKRKYVDICMQYYFRSHHQFIQDVTDAYIVSAFLDIMDINEVSSQPSSPVFSLMNDDKKTEWLNHVATDVLNELVSKFMEKFLRSQVKKKSSTFYKYWVY